MIRSNQVAPSSSRSVWSRRLLLPRHIQSQSVLCKRCPFLTRTCLCYLFSLRSLPLPSLRPVNSYLSSRTSFRCLFPSCPLPSPSQSASLLITVLSLFVPCGRQELCGSDIFDCVFVLTHSRVSFVLKADTFF